MDVSIRNQVHVELEQTEIVRLIIESIYELIMKPFAKNRNWFLINLMNDPAMISRAHKNYNLKSLIPYRTIGFRTVSIPFIKRRLTVGAMPITAVSPPVLLWRASYQFFQLLVHRRTRLIAIVLAEFVAGLFYV